MIVLENAYTYGVSIMEARRFTDEEKLKYSADFRDFGFLSISKKPEALPHVGWEDMPQRAPDGAFLGCSNTAWILTEAEAAHYRSLEAERADEERKMREAKEKELREMEAKRAAEEAAIRSQFERWDEVKVGHQSIRHIMTINGETLRFLERIIDDVGLVINPDYSVATGIAPGGIWTNDPEDGMVWMAFYSGKGWRKVRKLTENEVVCINAIRTTSSLAKRWRSMWKELEE